MIVFDTAKDAMAYALAKGDPSLAEVIQADEVLRVLKDGGYILVESQELDDMAEREAAATKKAQSLSGNLDNIARAVGVLCGRYHVDDLDHDAIVGQVAEWRATAQSVAGSRAISNGHQTWFKRFRLWAKPTARYDDE